MFVLSDNVNSVSKLCNSGPLTHYKIVKCKDEYTCYERRIKKYTYVVNVVCVSRNMVQRISKKKKADQCGISFW